VGIAHIFFKICIAFNTLSKSQFVTCFQRKCFFLNVFGRPLLKRTPFVYSGIKNTGFRFREIPLSFQVMFKKRKLYLLAEIVAVVGAEVDIAQPVTIIS
jgi:hypothetical protein